MNAIDLSNMLDTDGYIYREDSKKAAVMLRAQHEAIRQLREAVEVSMESSQWSHVPFMVRARIEAALTATETLT